ncbi:ATP-grasp domain-containing protein [Azospirillum melinis]|uniref:ATP-grasp domain-containing protein n=1 Tax=Azospirillum melinis TaxID=328839 RepID=A0ABX2K7S2_9PROT|nr:ATP-grasp domain-containing protein [Azospirillum melinis]MBP2305291.1 putative ATP-grasp superfamily ATP-dependent carboligase [Azospirillum melinis]NUA97757.1 ATP-grasp domain-containing protein [Azospirillum melinis]
MENSLRRVLVCEYVTGGALCNGPLPTDLMAEANAMVAALVGDLVALDGIHVTLCWDNRLAAPSFPADRVTLFPVAPGEEPEARWRAAAALCDVVWPIAPESDGLLAQVTALFHDTGRPVVACAADAIALASSKTATAARLAAHGIATIPTFPFGAPPPPAARHVVKPDDGAGCLDTFIVDDIASWTPPHTGRWIVQPLVEGEACSLSMLVDDTGGVRLLGCNRQKVKRGDGSFSFHGVEVGAMEHRRIVWEPLARAIAAAIPGLRGYVAVDLIDRPDDPDSNGPVVVEVNPRLSVGYSGLSRVLGWNPAGEILVLFHTRSADAGREDAHV